MWQLAGPNWGDWRCDGRMGNWPRSIDPKTRSTRLIIRASASPPMADRPRVLINCAASLDGKTAFADRSRARLSSEEDLARVHEMRNSVDAIVVGVGTILADDPSL